MGDWVVDKGLDRLLAQINAKAPGRRKDSDGSIGDAAHQSRDSDHNPESPPPPGNPDHQVDARDFTQDPEHGADMGPISEAIRQSQDRRVSYVIFNRRIFSSYRSTGGREAWAWGSYTGSDPHENHMHVSVNDTHHDETQDWQIIPTGGGEQGGGGDMTSMWNEDIVPNQGDSHDGGGYDPNANPNVTGKWGVAHGWREALQANRKADQLLASVNAVNAKLDQLLAHQSIGGVDVTAVADAVAPKVAGQLGQMVADRVRQELNATRLTGG